MQDNLEKPKRVRIFTHNIKKETNMKINETNKQHIHDVLIKDMQRRLFNDYKAMRKNNPQVTDEDYDNALSTMVNSILQCNSINDINDLLLDYTDVFDTYDDINVFTLDGTMNYVLSLVLEYYTRFKHKSLYYEEE